MINNENIDSIGEYYNFQDEVCSPGGSTIRGVEQLEKGGVRAAVMAAVKAAAERNEELGKK